MRAGPVKSFSWSVAIATALWTLGATCAWAQGSLGGLRGAVRDANGVVPGAQVALTNQGTILANQPNGLTIDPNAGGVTNSGTMKATAGAGLTLTGGSFTNTNLIQADAAAGAANTVILTSSATLTNTGGTLAALNGSSVDLRGTSIVGGTLSTSGTGTIHNTQGATLSGLTNAGNYAVVVTNSGRPGGILSAIATVNVLLDSDGDHMPDVWENAYHLNPSVDDANLDPANVTRLLRVRAVQKTP